MQRIRWKTRPGPKLQARPGPKLPGAVLQHALQNNKTAEHADLFKSQNALSKRRTRKRPKMSNQQKSNNFMLVYLATVVELVGRYSSGQL
jgi:hypothetical protein